MLPAPRLDDRSFQDLVDDAKRLVMRECPEWTDHNVSDPGVTLIESFAFMTDALLYRLNRVPDRLYVTFLDLIGLRMIPASPARLPLTFWLSAPPDAAFVIPAGTEAATERTEAKPPIVFSTVEDLEVVPCALVGLATQPGPAVLEQPVEQPDELPDELRGETLQQVHDRPGEIADHTSSLEQGHMVAAFSSPPVIGDTVYLGLDTAAPRCAVRLDVVAQAEGVGVNPLRPPLVWEAFCAGAWLACDVSTDGTGGLNRSGDVVVHVPAGHEVSVLAGQGCGWLRARVVEPEPGQPPYTRSPVIGSVAACTVGGTTTGVNAEVVPEESLGDSEGLPGQRFSVDSSPVLAGAGEPVVEVSSENGWQTWERVEHFAHSGPADRHIILDAYAGEVSFGPMVRLQDGGTRQYGAVPAPGARVRIRDFAVGGGPAGNVAAHTVTSLRSSMPFVTSVENRYAGSGGTAGETLREAMQRGPLLLRTRDRAVTVEDYEMLARAAAPEVARVRCVPADGGEVPAGAVKVLVVPAAASERWRVALEDLIPSEEVLARIAQRLDETRVAGVNVRLEPPRYRGVTVVCRLIARPRVSAGQVEADALDALYRLINPLPGGGPDGQGWPFGRPVQAGEMFAALRDVRGVDMVEDLRLFGADPVTGRRGSEVQRLDLDPHSLVFSFEHHVRVEEH